MDDRKAFLEEFSQIRKHTEYLRSRCTIEGCNDLARTGGTCVRHGGRRHGKICAAEGCASRARSWGLCDRHGGCLKRPQCKVEGCTSWSAFAGNCAVHTLREQRLKYYCMVEGGGLHEYEQSKGLCGQHGGRVPLPLRKVEGCTKCATGRVGCACAILIFVTRLSRFWCCCCNIQ